MKKTIALILLIIPILFSHYLLAQETIFLMAEKTPEFPGGTKALSKYLRRNLNYPKEARRMGIEGKVFVEFIVDTDGSIVDVKVVKGIGAGCDEEAVRVLKSSPKWIPGEVRNESVKVKMSIPIVFKLTGRKKKNNRNKLNTL